MKKIIVTIPEPKNKWTVSFGAGTKNCMRADIVLTYLTRKIGSLLERGKQKKTAIRVRDVGRYLNETCSSSDVVYLTYATSCFLEDYLSKEVLKKYQRAFEKG